MSTKSNKYLFTIREAYKLGDAFYDDGKLIAAEVCYAFAEMKPLPMPIPDDAAVDPNKLSNLIAYRKRINYPVPKKCRGKGKDIPQDCLKLIQAFYDPWLQQIKPDMKERSDEHAQRRMKGVIEVFKAVTNDRLGQLVLDDIAKANHRQQIDKIDAWNGPSFGKFQIRDNQKMKNNFSLSRLTVVLDFKNYRKRCRNSQEDWFKAIDGRFFAQCLNKAYKIFVDKFPDDKERQYVGILFVKAVLDKYIQFPSASAKLLVPAGTIFANPELMETIHRFHPHINPTQIKQKARSRAVRVLHKRLMEDVNTEYDRICSSMQNPLLTFTNKHQQSQPSISPPSTTETSTPEVSANTAANNNNNNDAAAPQRTQPRFSPQNSSSFGSEADEIVNNDDGFLQMMVNNDDIEMNAINTTNPGAENTENINVLGMESRPGLERNYSFNGSDGSSFIHNEHGSTSGQSDNDHDEDENADLENGWITSPAEPLCPVVQFPLLSNRNNTTITTNLSTQTPRITNPFAPTPMIVEQQQQTQQISYQQQPQQPQQPQQVQQVQFQFQMTQEQPQTDPQLPDLPDNLNIAAWINDPQKDQKNQEIEEIVNVNNGNDEVMTTVNIPAPWDGMTQIGTDVVNGNSNQSMMPLIINDDNQTTFQPLPITQPMRVTMDAPQIQTQPQTTSCPPHCNCHLNNHQNNQNNEYCPNPNDQQYYNQTNQTYYDQNNENYQMNQESLPPVPTPMPHVQQQHNHSNCACSFCKDFGGTSNNPNVNNMANSYTPSLHTPSVDLGTRSVVSGDARSVGTGSASGSSAFVMNGNNPYKTIQIQAPSQYMQQQYNSRQSSPGTVIYEYTPSNSMSNPFGSQVNHQQAMPQTTKEVSVNAFGDDTFEIENPMSVAQDMCMGCYETVTQCKCDVIAMQQRYKPNFQNTSTFNTRNNRIHHQNMQSISNYTANNRKQRRQSHIEQLNNIRMREINNNQNYNNYNNNNWCNSMNVRTF